MDADPKNPITNKLQGGATEEQLLRAVQKSGYPLQHVVANKLRRIFRVEEEWSFVDRDSQALRALDIHASTQLYDVEHRRKSHVRPELDLLVECKQSELPYVFFLSNTKPWLPKFPLVAGLFEEFISVKTDGDRSTWSLPILEALSLSDHPFIIGNEVYFSMSFSKCVRKGSEIELSGAESFQGLVLPLVKSLQHFLDYKKPPKTARYHDLHLTFAIAVIDAPIVGVKVGTDEKPSLLSLPWVRVVRQEAVEAEHWLDRSRSYAIEVVHKDFLDSFLDVHLLPFAREYSASALKHDVELAVGRGFVSGMNLHPRKSIERRLRPA